MTGSIAVTRPLAGACAWIWLPRHTWLTGSRFETTTSSRPASCWPTNCFSRASVHTLSPDRRSAASCCAAAWARCMLRARRETSRASGPNRLASATLGGGIGRPLRSARVHSEISAIGRVMLTFTTSAAMIEMTAASTRNRIAL